MADPVKVRSALVPTGLTAGILGMLLCMAAGTFLLGFAALLYGMIVRFFGGTL